MCVAMCVAMCVSSRTRHGHFGTWWLYSYAWRLCLTNFDLLSHRRDRASRTGRKDTPVYESLGSRAMSGSRIACRQPVILCRGSHRHPARSLGSRVLCTVRKDTRYQSPRSACQHASSDLASGRSLETGSSEQDRFRVSAASPALDSSGGDLPPINHNIKAVGDGDDDSENNSAQDIDSILAKVFNYRCCTLPR